ncbi:MAG: ATP-dependent zinc metalloprotease FtsH [Lachnospiraceae bacterium]|nr:ATP-dependent zinc metalloprotease FtsH [Lachnospiraceae bacterium]
MAINNYDNGGGDGYNNQNGGDNNGNRNRNGNNGNKRKQTIIILVVAVLVTLIASTVMSELLEKATTKEITYDKFVKQIKNDEIEKVVFSGQKIIITPKDSKNVEDEEEQDDVNFALGSKYFGNGYTEWTTRLDDENIIQLLEEKNVKFKGEVSDEKSSIKSFIFEFLLPLGIIYIIMSLLFRRISKGSGMMGVGKSNAKVYMEKETGVTFEDVAGQEEAKESLTEIVDFLHNPGKYSSIGAKLPKGALLVGPPGTGKTLLAKAVAGEAKVPFFSISGSDFVEMFVGVGASRVRDLFKQAQQSAPCIIFIDEVDAIGKSRDGQYGGGNDEREQTLNQLLSEMDGFDSSKGLFILGATNRPEVLDKALLRPGRFDRRIIVDVPDLKGRIDILKVHTKNVPMDETVDLKGVAFATAGSVGADLANMVNEAAINAVKNGKKAISQKDLLDAVELVIAGKEKKNKILSEKEKKIVAYHEVGHAIVSAFQNHTEPVQKITIIPRTGGALGYVMHYPEEEKNLQTKDELISEIVTLFGGRAAEEVTFDSVTGGAANDMEQATNIAWNMITRFGMSERFGMMKLASVQSQYLDGGAKLTCSDQTATLVDEEVNKLLKECYAKAKEIVTTHQDVLEQISLYLYDKETLTGQEFLDIFERVTGEKLDEHYNGETDDKNIQ